MTWYYFGGPYYTYKPLKILKINHIYLMVHMGEIINMPSKEYECITNTNASLRHA